MPLSFQPYSPHVNPRKEEDIIKVYIYDQLAYLEALGGIFTCTFMFIFTFANTGVISFSVFAL